MYWTDTEYRDDRGAVIVLRDFFHPDGLGEHKCFGKGMTILKTPMGEIPQEFEVDLETGSVATAFANFEEIMSQKAPEAAEAAAREVEEQMKQKMQDQSQSIITPEQIRNAAQFNPNIRG